MGLTSFLYHPVSVWYRLAPFVFLVSISCHITSDLSRVFSEYYCISFVIIVVLENTIFYSVLFVDSSFIIVSIYYSFLLNIICIQIHSSICHIVHELSDMLAETSQTNLQKDIFAAAVSL